MADPYDLARGREVREELRRQNDALRAEVARLKSILAGVNQTTSDGSEPNPDGGTPGASDSEYNITPGVYPADPYEGRGDYPRKSHLSVLADLESEIKVHDPTHVDWIIQQMGECDPDLGGEEPLDKDLAPGVEVRQLAAIVPTEGENCGALAVSAPGTVVGPTRLWMKTTNVAGGFGGLRGRGEWMVPPGCTATDCRILYLHGGSFMWYSGVDHIYQPLTSRIAAAAGMPVLVIDSRLSPEFTCVAAIEDCLDALVWMDANGPDGPAKARKLFICGDSSGGGQVLNKSLYLATHLTALALSPSRPSSLSLSRSVF